MYPEIGAGSKRIFLLVCEWACHWGLHFGTYRPSPNQACVPLRSLLIFAAVKEGHATPRRYPCGAVSIYLACF